MPRSLARRSIPALATLPVLAAGALAGAVLLATAAPTSLAAQRPAAAPRADVVITGARIYTVDPARPVAAAMALRGGRVQFVGSERGAMALRGPATRVVSYAGHTIVPGITDAHAHLLGLGTALRQVDLTGAASLDEVVSRVAARARQMPAGAWVLGRGWDQNDWGNTRLPTNEALSRAVPDRPVALTRVDGHALLANARAMQAAGITADTPDPAGGRIVRDSSGTPTGVFVDNAQALIERVIPPLSAAERRAAIVSAVREANRWGLTGVHDAGAERETIEVYESLARADSLPLRVYAMIAGDSATIATFRRRGPESALYDGRLWIRSIKLYADGALGSRGAALLDPYSDDPANSGLLVTPPAEIRAIATQALRDGFQVNVHAIGDRGNRLVLDAFEAALSAVPTSDPRFRIEHAQIINPADLPRFQQLGVIPSMQTSHQTSDMYWAPTRLGVARLGGAYAWRSLLDGGSIIPNGTDFPVEQVNPIISFHSAVTRQDANNYPPGGWWPSQRMTREEALRSLTLWPAVAGFQESMLGSLTPGKYADFVVLDQDIMRVAPEQILDTQVVATYVGGTPVYERNSSR